MIQKDFVHTQGKDIIDPQGKKLMLRGVGLGSWMLPEGYMWRFPNQGDRPRKIEKIIASLIGEEDARTFWQRYYRNYIAKADIDKIADDGFNSVRIPLLWRFLIDENRNINEDHWKILDDIINHCDRRNVYVILDLHGAPGGQTGANIDDCENDIPELFTSVTYQDQTVFLWKEIATRYRNSQIIACYDLLNEPVPEFHGQVNDQVYPFYDRLIKEIRSVDPYHMISLEGIHWSTDWSIFTHKLDDNVLYQFHKYWNRPDAESLKKYLDLREKWDVPIFMGEGGENNKEWYCGAFAMYEDLDISWNFWTYKKMDTTNSMVSVRRPKEWHRLTEYMEKGTELSKEDAQGILGEYLENLKLENCVLVDEVVNSLFRRPDIEIPAIFYSWDQEARIQNSRNLNVGFRVDDGRDIIFVQGDRDKPNFAHGGGASWNEDEWLCVRTQSNESLNYWFTCRKAMRVALCVDVIVNTVSKVNLTVNDKTSEMNLNQLGRQCADGAVIEVPDGKSSILIHVLEGDVQWISIKIKKVSDDFNHQHHPRRNTL